MESSEFYLNTEPDEDFLKNRQIRYVFAYEPERLISNSQQILGRTAKGATIAERLYKNSSDTPNGLIKIFVNRFFRIYETVPQSPDGHEP